jgi:hypothetical protein
MLYYTNAEGMKMFEKLKRFWKNLWGNNLPPEPVRKQENTCGSLNPQVIDIMSRAPKVPPTATHKPMDEEN